MIHLSLLKVKVIRINFQIVSKLNLPKSYLIFRLLLKVTSIFSGKYHGMDHDEYEHTITNECLQQGAHDLPDEGTYESQDRYDPFNVHMGQMTVYR